MKKAFTLAEVLITMGIIGVVAAITIPAIVQNMKNKEMVVKLKKTYNVLKSIERQVVVEHGPMSEWAWTGNSVKDFETYFKHYFDILKDCGTGTGCFAKERYYLSGPLADSNFDADKDHYKFIAADGVSYYYWSREKMTPVSSIADVGVDLNGAKGPNKWGRDIFQFSIFPTLGVKPFGAYNADTAVPESLSTIDANCSLSGSGGRCAVKVLTEDAMNY